MSEPTGVAERGLRKPHRRIIPLWLPIAILAFLVLAGITLFAYLYLPTGGMGPRLQVDQDRADLGDQHFNSVVRAKFEIRNSGDRPLNLTLPKTATAIEGC